MLLGSFFGSEKFVVLKIFLTFDTMKYLLYKRGSWELKSDKWWGRGTEQIIESLVGYIMDFSFYSV